MSRYLFFILTLFCFQSLLSQEELNYSLEEPNEIYKLPEYLEEVSALTHFEGSMLAMLNDELGRMYLFDLDQKSIDKRVRFKGNGDFEGIERVGDYIYAIKSDGDLYKFHVDVEGVVEEITTPFSKSNNVEGIAYDPFNNRLLFALKDSGDVGNFDVKGRGIYAYDLALEKFLEAPQFVILNDDLERVVGKDFRFKPSGLAVHPNTGELFVISANDKALMVFHQDGTPKNLSMLKGKLFPQPEGIAFAPDGTLYISNEQDDEGGTILEFKELIPRD